MSVYDAKRKQVSEMTSAEKDKLLQALLDQCGLVAVVGLDRYDDPEVELMTRADWDKKQDAE